MSQTKEFTATVRIQSNPYGATGKAIWGANLRSDNSIALEMNLPGNRVLTKEDLSEVHLAQHISGWKNPRELGKTALVTAGSFFGGALIIDSIGEGEESLKALKGLIGMMTIALPAGYGAYTLSRKAVRLLITTTDGNVIVVELPENLAMLIIGVFSSDDPKPDDVAETVEAPA